MLEPLARQELAGRAAAAQQGARRGGSYIAGSVKANIQDREGIPDNVKAKIADHITHAQPQAEKPNGEVGDDDRPKIEAPGQESPRGLDDNLHTEVKKATAFTRARTAPTGGATRRPTPRPRLTTVRHAAN